MKQTTRSLGYSITGLRHAVAHEANLRKFLFLEIFLLLAAIALGDFLLFIALLMVGGGFTIVELFNTAIERLADTFDDCEKQRNSGHFHPGIKMTKDVASAASLIALIVYGVIAVLGFLPHITLLFFSFE